MIVNDIDCLLASISNLVSPNAHALSERCRTRTRPYVRQPSSTDLCVSEKRSTRPASLAMFAGGATMREHMSTSGLSTGAAEWMGAGSPPSARSVQQSLVATGADRSPNATMRRQVSQQRRSDGLLPGTTHSMPQGAAPGSAARAAAAIEAAAAVTPERAALSLEPTGCAHCRRQADDRHELEMLRAQLAEARAELAEARAQGFVGGGGAPPSPLSSRASAEGVPPTSSRHSSGAAAAAPPDGAALRISGAGLEEVNGVRHCLALSPCCAPRTRLNDMCMCVLCATAVLCRAQRARRRATCL